MRGQLPVAHWLSFVCRSYNYAIIVLLTEIKAPVISVVPVRFTDREVGLVSPLQFSRMRKKCLSVLG